jgi:hypothetical protein
LRIIDVLSNLIHAWTYTSGPCAVTMFDEHLYTGLIVHLGLSGNS